MYEPLEIRAGDTVEWTEDWSSKGYSASNGWTAQYTFFGPKKQTVDGVADGTGFTFTLTAALSGALTAGSYGLICRVSKSPEVYTVFDGRVTVKLNPTGTADGADVRSTAQIICESIEAYWTTKNPDCVSSLSALGVVVNYKDDRNVLAVYNRWKRQWDAELAKDRSIRGQATGKTYYLRF
jgi:hypothetical protein